jgi:hypothetical protein
MAEPAPRSFLDPLADVIDLDTLHSGHILDVPARLAELADSLTIRKHVQQDVAIVTARQNKGIRIRVGLQTGGACLQAIQQAVPVRYRPICIRAVKNVFYGTDADGSVANTGGKSYRTAGMQGLHGHLIPMIVWSMLPVLLVSILTPTWFTSHS